MFRKNRETAPKNTRARTVSVARIATTTAAGYASANETAGVKFILFKSEQLPLNTTAT